MFDPSRVAEYSGRRVIGVLAAGATIIAFLVALVAIVVGTSVGISSQARGQVTLADEPMQCMTPHMLASQMLTELPGVTAVTEIDREDALKILGELTKRFGPPPFDFEPTFILAALTDDRAYFAFGVIRCVHPVIYHLPRGLWDEITTVTKGQGV